MNTRRSPGVHVGQAQPEHLAAAQPGQHHRQHHRPVPVRAQRRHQRVHLVRRRTCGSVRGTRTSGTVAAAAAPPGRQAPRHRVGRTATSPRAIKYANSPDTLDNRRCDRPRRHTPAISTGPASRHHARCRCAARTRTHPPRSPRPGPCRRPRRTSSGHRPTASTVFGRHAARNELQIGIQQRYAQPQHRAARRSSRRSGRGIKGLAKGTLSADGALTRGRSRGYSRYSSARSDLATAGKGLERCSYCHGKRLRCCQ